MKDQEKEAMKSPNELSKINWKHIEIYVFTKFIWESLDFVQNQGELLGCQHIIDGQVMMWPKENTIDDVVVIGE